MTVWIKRRQEWTWNTSSILCVPIRSKDRELSSSSHCHLKEQILFRAPSLLLAPETSSSPPPLSSSSSSSSWAYGSSSFHLCNVGHQVVWFFKRIFSNPGQSCHCHQNQATHYKEGCDVLFNPHLPEGWAPTGLKYLKVKFSNQCHLYFNTSGWYLALSLFQNGGLIEARYLSKVQLHSGFAVHTS